MADNSASFSIDMKDQLSGPTAQATAQLEKLKSALQAQQAELKSLVSAQKFMQGASSVNIADYKKVQDRIKNVKDAMSANQSAYVKAGGSLSTLSKKTVEHTEKAKEQAGGLDKLVSKYDKWGVTSDKAGTSANLAALGAAGAAAAIVALEAALVAGAVALVSFAIHAADVVRTMALMRIGFAGGVDNASALGMHIDQLSRKLPQTRVELQEIAKALAGEGLQGNTLVDATKAVATTAAAMGQGAASKIQSIITQANTARRLVLGAFDLKGTGISIDDVAKSLATQMKTSTATAKQALMTGGVDVKSGMTALNAALDDKFGGTIAKLMTSLPTLWEKAKENLGQLFSGVDIEPLLTGLGSMAHMLDQNTATGKLLKQTLTGVVQPLVDGLVKAMPIAKSLFYGMIVGALGVELVAIRLHTALKKLIPPSLRPDINGTSAAFTIGAVIVGVLAGAFLTLAAAALLCSLVLALPFIVLGVAIYLGYRAVKAGWGLIKDTFNAAIGFMGSQVSVFGDIGTAIIDALVNSITGGSGRVTGSVKGLMSDTVQAAKDSIKMKSPPRVYVDMGKASADAYAMGVDMNADKASISVAGMVGDAATAGASAAGSGPSTGGRSIQFHFANGAIQVHAGGNVEDPAFERKFVSMMRRSLTSVGVPVLG